MGTSIMKNFFFDGLCACSINKNWVVKNKIGVKDIAQTSMVSWNSFTSLRISDRMNRPRDGESRPMGSVESDLRMCSLASLRTQWPPSCFLNEAIRKRTWLVRFTCVQDRMPNPRPLTFNTPPLTRGRFSETFTAIRSQTPTLSNIEIKKCLGVTTYCIMFLCYLSTLWLQSLRPKAIIKYRNIIFKRVSRNYDLKMRHLK